MGETSITLPDFDHKHPLCTEHRLANHKFVELLPSNFGIMARAKRHRTGSDRTADSPKRRRTGRRRTPAGATGRHRAGPYVRLQILYSHAEHHGELRPRHQ